ncbi:hypothetical protein [Streptomyces sp. NPDC058614]|uniref:hypothetical protein n=1 Tax=Streptomyces sp. NPDC058614 TaxID=3346557 RepID=UPI00364D205D
MTTTATHLITVLRHWNDLHNALGTRATQTWPPAGRMTDYLNHLDNLDAEEQEAERHRALALRTLERDPSQPGHSAAPLRIPLLDTMRTVQAALIECADITAAAVQRAPMGLLPATYPAADRARRELLAMKDAHDPRRWKWTGTRTAQHAALWLYCRITDQHGPFAPLTDEQRVHIRHVAEGAAERIERALDIAVQRAPLARPCPECGGQLEMHGGAGANPVAHCTSCGKVWAEGVIAA